MFLSVSESLSHTVSQLYIYIYMCVWCVCVCVFPCVCTVSEDIGINNEKGICAWSMESKIGHRCEKPNMASKCEMLMNCSKNFIKKTRKT